MSETRKEIIKNTLDAFLSIRIDEGDEENSNIHAGGVAVDEVDTEILSDAIVQALEKEKIDENKN